MSAAQKRLDALVERYPTIITPAAVAEYLGRDPQHLRNSCKAGHYPFATVEVCKRKARTNYTIPTLRFVAWLEGRL